jgi:hypothetical protein
MGEDRGTARATCVYDVYLAVHARVREVAQDAPGEMARVRANIDVLLGAPRIAAGLAQLDAEAGRPPRELHVVCRGVCESPCEEHPDRRRDRPDARLTAVEPWPKSPR